MGDYEQSNSGILEIELGGRIPESEFDVLQIDGSAMLGGLQGNTRTRGNRRVCYRLSRLPDIAAVYRNRPCASVPTAKQQARIAVWSE